MIIPDELKYLTRGHLINDRKSDIHLAVAQTLHAASRRVTEACTTNNVTAVHPVTRF